MCHKGLNFVYAKINYIVQLQNCYNVEIDHNNIVSKSNGLRVLNAQEKHTIQAVPKVSILDFLHLIFQFKRLIKLLFHSFFSFGAA